MNSIRSGLAALSCAALFGVIAPPAAGASSLLIDKGSYTADPGSHLDWLDVTQTVGLSYNDVLGNNGVSFIAQGWRYATAGDLLTFYTDAGLPMAGQPDMFRTAQDADFSTVATAMLHLYSLVGIIDTGVTAVDHWYQSEGFFGPLDAHGNPGPGNPGQGGLALDLRRDETDSGLSAIIDAGILDADTRSTGFGSWLVRDDNSIPAVPLPGALILFASALVCICVAGRRRRAKPAEDIDQAPVA